MIGRAAGGVRICGVEVFGGVQGRPDVDPCVLREMWRREMLPGASPAGRLTLDLEDHFTSNRL
jgi:hypothetical protein